MEREGEWRERENGEKERGGRNNKKDKTNCIQTLWKKSTQRTKKQVPLHAVLHTLSLTISFVNIPNVWRYVLAGAVRGRHAAHTGAPHGPVVVVHPVFSIDAAIGSYSRPGGVATFSIHGRARALLTLSLSPFSWGLLFLVRKSPFFEGNK